MQASARRRAATTLPARDPRRRGEALRASGDNQGALLAFMQAARKTPQDAAIHATIASVLSDMGQHQGAIGAGLTAVTLAPASARSQAELGRALFLAGQVEAALEPCARAVVLAPRNLPATVTFGAVLFTLGRHEQALQVAQEAVSIDPLHFQSRGNLALALEALGRLDEAEAHSRLALAMDPASPAARHNLAGLRLSRGKLDAESWRLYDARLELTPEARALAAIPRWRGEDVANRTILLHAEQGFGDMIQFARYAPAVKARGARVVLAVPGPLLRLMTGLPGTDVVVRAGGAIPAHDVFCPIASLPGILGTTLQTIPAPIPYLTAATEAVMRFRPAPGFNVGLVWAGNPSFVHDRLRSVGPATFAVLERAPGVTFHSLQKADAPPFPMQNRMAEVADFADTAGLIAGMDLVIAVDTAVAHLAGAMGKPVWMLSRFMGCWRWLRDRDDSPWYPTMRIFRQHRSGDWDGVLQQVRDALDTQANSVRGREPLSHAE